MPTVSQFYGIHVMMRYSERHGPHFHAEYAGEKAQISILNGEVLSGKLRGRAYRLILEWLALHREQLMDNWERARRHEKVEWIEGLD
ncbi:MAG: DUF4160 domain-containing protein [Chloroflexi bacterium]|nr:DUF4160 domain-containing protein [Chloroflexota bacterium]